jgi:RNA polymerase sigma-70 factor (ECF subfamily)
MADAAPPRTTSTLTPDLMALVAKGDPRAFERLFDHSHGTLYALAAKILGNPDEAADLLLDVYAEVWKKSLRYDSGRGSPMAWLVLTTRSRALDRVRARGPRRQGIGESPDEPAANDGPDKNPASSDDHQGLTLRKAVEQALAELPDGQREAIESAFYGGLSHADIAARSKQPAGTVKPLIQSGMAALRSSLQPWWELL